MNGKFISYYEQSLRKNTSFAERWVIMFCKMLYVFFWVIPRRLNFICRRIGTLCSVFIGK
jgi:hypothetical protein